MGDVKSLLMCLLLQATALVHTNAQNIDSLIEADVAITDWESISYPNTPATKILNSNETNKWNTLDAQVLDIRKRYMRIKPLARALTKNYASDEEKIRAIFRWEAENIAYDVKLLKKNRKGKRFIYLSTWSKEKIERKRQKYDYRYATKVLRKRKGICEGYADLFQALCDEAGLTSYKISGYANNDTIKVAEKKKSGKFGSNHAWNIVQLNGKWYMLDATWASGYLDKKRTYFTREFKDYYYLSPVEEGFPSHLIKKLPWENRKVPHSISTNK